MHNCFHSSNNNSKRLKNEQRKIACQTLPQGPLFKREKRIENMFLENFFVVPNSFLCSEHFISEERRPDMLESRGLGEMVETKIRMLSQQKLIEDRRSVK